MNGLRVLVCVALIGLAGCAGTGEKIPITIPGPFTGSAASASSGPRVAVVPFEDKRTDQRYLGRRVHLWGGESYFDVPSGMISKAVAEALVEYLTRQGWRASLAQAPGGSGADVTIQGTITELSVNATGGFMHTDLAAKNSLAFQIVNHSDDSIVRERVSGSATDQVFWFDQEDAQALVTDLLESNFRKFVSDVRIDGRAIRLR